MPPRRIRTNPTSAPPPVHPNVGEPIKQRRPRGLLIGLVFGALVAAAAGFLLLRGGDGGKSAQVANAIDNEVPANSPAKSDTTSAPADRPAVADDDGSGAPKTGVPTRDPVDSASLADMSKLHGEVSAALERVKPNKRGRKAAKKLRSRFAAIKYQNAVKDAELRADVIAQLHALQNDVSRTLTKQRRRRDRSKKRRLEKGAVIDAFAN